MQISEYYDSVASFWDDDFSEARAARIVASTVSIPRGGACVLDIGCGSGSMFLDLMESGACEIEVDCAACADKMEVAAKKTPGVRDAVVNFMTLKMAVEFEDGADPKAVMKDVLANCKKVEDDCEIYL